MRQGRGGRTAIDSQASTTIVMNNGFGPQVLEELLPILSCPECRNDRTLVVDSASAGIAARSCPALSSEVHRDYCLQCPDCRRFFPVTRDGIPLMWSDGLLQAIISSSIAPEPRSGEIRSLAGESSSINVKEANVRVYEAIIADYAAAGVHADATTGSRVLSALRMAHPDLRTLAGWHVDVGCGSGNMLELVRASSGAVKFLGLDLSLSALRRIRGARREFFAVLGDAEALPLKSDSAALVTASSVLHHLHTPGRFIAEAGRVLAPDGGLLLTDFDPHSVAADWSSLLRNAYGARRLVYRAAHALAPKKKVAHKDSRVQEWNELAEYHNGPGAGFDTRALGEQLENAGMRVLTVFLHNTLDAQVTASTFVRPKARHVLSQLLSGRNPFARKNSDTILTLSRKNRGSSA